MAIPKRELGRTGLPVTVLGYGAMELRGAPRGRDVTEAQAETILNAVLDAGINYIDTSIDYGLSEERIGRYIGHRRDEYYLASKCGCLVGAPPAPPGERNPHVFTRENIITGVEQSLRRMKTDHLDVVQFHSSPSKRILEENGPSTRCSNSKMPERCVSPACQAPFPTSETTSRWASSTSSRFPIPPSSANTRRQSRRLPRLEQESSSAAGRPRARRRRRSGPECNGAAGHTPPSMICCRI